MSEKDDFLSFDKALSELKLRSEELRKLVSQGEIRAFREGDSMKFRADDVQALGSKAQGEEELAFADSLEDDTGMVTEELSAEDTLLVEEEEEEVKPRASKRRSSSRAPAARPASAPAAAQEVEQEPGWVTACAIVGFLVLIWGFILTYSISQESDPQGNVLTSGWWADKPSGN